MKLLLPGMARSSGGDRWFTTKVPCRTRQGRGKGWYLALETQGQAVPYQESLGEA